FDTVQKGLALRITESGHKSWSVHYRVDGKLRRHTIGTVDTFSLAKAREKAYEAARDAAPKGKDAGAEKRAKRQQATQGESIADLVKAYLEKHAKRHKKSWRDDDRMFNAEVLPKWRHRKAKDITRRDVRALIEAIADRGSPITANRCL